MNLPIILCVDDDQMCLDSLKYELLNYFERKYHVEAAESGEEALELFEELLEKGYEVPLIIADYIMPNMKGDILLKRIHAIAPRTVKVMLTGQADKEAVIKAVNYANLYRYIAKPWDKEDLVLTVSEAIKSYFKDKQLDEQNRALKEINAELSAKNEALVKLNQEKNEFLSIAAHDLKTPLSTIIGLVEEIQESFDELSKEEIIQLTNIVLMGSDRMFQLITNLLDVNRIESGKLNVSLKVFDILPLLKSLMTEYAPKALKKNIRLQCQCQEKEYLALADEKLVNQVLENLMSNAIKFSPQGKNIFVRITKNEQYLLCEIEDEGPGLSESDKQQLFCKFTQLASMPTGGEDSTGLGLFIVKKLMEAMKGIVWCESKLGQGAKFIVAFLISH